MVYYIPTVVAIHLGATCTFTTRKEENYMQILQSRDGFHVANLTTTEFKAWIALRERKPESSRFDLSMEDAEALSMKIRDEVVRIKSDREKKGDHDDGNL